MQQVTHVHFSDVPVNAKTELSEGGAPCGFHPAMWHARDPLFDLFEEMLLAHRVPVCGIGALHLRNALRRIGRPELQLVLDVRDDLRIGDGRCWTDHQEPFLTQTLWKPSESTTKCSPDGQ